MSTIEITQAQAVSLRADITKLLGVAKAAVAAASATSALIKADVALAISASGSAADSKLDAAQSLADCRTLAATLGDAAGFSEYLANLQAASVGFVYSNASTTWHIAHNLQRHPFVVAVDTAGDQIYGDVFYVDSNNISVTFGVPTSGIAYLN